MEIDFMTTQMPACWCMFLWRKWNGFCVNPAPVEYGSLSQYLHGFMHPRWLDWFLPSTVSTTPLFHMFVSLSGLHQTGWCIANDAAQIRSQSPSILFQKPESSRTKTSQTCGNELENPSCQKQKKDANPETPKWNPRGRFHKLPRTR